MRRMLLVVLGAGLLGCSDLPTTPRPAPDDASFRTSPTTTNYRVPYTETLLVPCAAGGAGELVTLTGTLHFVGRVMPDAGGGFHARNLIQLQAVSGIGHTTGDRYRGSGVIQDVYNDVGAETTSVRSTFHVVGPGPGNDFLLHVWAHVTVTPDGTTTAEVRRSSTECR